MKGVTLQIGTAVVLELDGTLVWVEAIEPTHAAVVALPDQPAGVTDRMFVPGRVGAKKISQFLTAAKVVPPEELTERNLKFINEFAALRAANGPNYVDRTPEELAAMTVTKVDPAAVKTQKRLDKALEREAAKMAARAAKSQRTQLCADCNQQPGHPNHPGDHEFVAPTATVKMAESDETKPTGGGASPQTVGATKTRGTKSTMSGRYRWCGDDARLAVLAAGNPKYNEKNTGSAIVQAVKDMGDDATVDAVIGELASHPRWATKGAPPRDRIELAFTQLLAAGLIEAVQ